MIVYGGAQRCGRAEGRGRGEKESKDGRELQHFGGGDGVRRDGRRGDVTSTYTNILLPENYE